MDNVFVYTIYYRAEKPYGVGRTANERHLFIVGGYRAEIISGLKDGHSVYTSACGDEKECKQELVLHLKRLGYSGILRKA